MLRPSATLHPTIGDHAGEFAADERVWTSTGRLAVNHSHVCVFVADTQWSWTSATKHAFARHSARRKCKEVKCKNMNFNDGYGQW